MSTSNSSSSDGQSSASSRPSGRLQERTSRVRGRRRPRPAPAGPSAWHQQAAERARRQRTARNRRARRRARIRHPSGEARSSPLVISLLSEEDVVVSGHSSVHSNSGRTLDENPVLGAQGAAHSRTDRSGAAQGAGSGASSVGRGGVDSNGAIGDGGPDDSGGWTAVETVSVGASSENSEAEDSDSVHSGSLLTSAMDRVDSTARDRHEAQTATSSIHSPVRNGNSNHNGSTRPNRNENQRRSSIESGNNSSHPHSVINQMTRQYLLSRHEAGNSEQEHSGLLADGSNEESIIKSVYEYFRRFCAKDSFFYDYVTELFLPLRVDNPAMFKSIKNNQPFVAQPVLGENGDDIDLVVSLWDNGIRNCIGKLDGAIVERLEACIRKNRLRLLLFCVGKDSPTQTVVLLAVIHTIHVAQGPATNFFSGPRFRLSKRLYSSLQSLIRHEFRDQQLSERWAFRSQFYRMRSIPYFEKEFAFNFADFHDMCRRIASTQRNIAGSQSQPAWMDLSQAIDSRRQQQRRERPFSLAREANLLPSSPTAAVNSEEVMVELEQLFVGKDHLSIPQMEPDPRVSFTLYDFQKQGLSFMVQRERSMSYFLRQWQDKGSIPENSCIDYFSNILEDDDGSIHCFNEFLKERQRLPVKRARGGLLADDMGLGKTVQMVSLIVSNPIYAISDEVTGRNKLPTLIVCPTSLLATWKEHFHKMLPDDALRIFIFHGSEATNADLSGYDVIVTSYGTLRSQYSPIEKIQRSHKQGDPEPDIDSLYQRIPLFRVIYGRMILDESHKCKNPCSLTYRAASSIRRYVTWCLSGTPLLNRISELYTTFALIGVGDINTISLWRKHIGNLIRRTPGENNRQAVSSPPLQIRNTDAFRKLLLLMKLFGLRRTKHQYDSRKRSRLVPDLANVQNTMEYCKLGKMQVRMYVALHTLFTSLAAEMQQLAVDGSGEVSKSALKMQNLSTLSLITRLRQYVTSISLVPRNLFREVRRISLEREARPRTTLSDRERLNRLERHIGSINRAHDEENEAFDQIRLNDDKIALAALQQQLQSQLTRLEQGQVQEAPSSSASGASTSGASASNDVNSLEDENANEIENVFRQSDEDYESLIQGLYRQFFPKESRLIQRVAEDLYRTDDKIIIFSQWTKFLDRISLALNAVIPDIRDGKIIIARYDGKMDVAEKSSTIAAFKNMREVRILLASLLCAGEGLNLVCANRVYMADMYWNRAQEDQACQRVFRIGQRKSVFITKFCVPKTIDETLVEIKSDKMKLFQGAVAGTRDKNATHTDLFSLDGSGAEATMDESVKSMMDSHSFVSDHLAKIPNLAASYSALTDPYSEKVVVHRRVGVSDDIQDDPDDSDDPDWLPSRAAPRRTPLNVST